MSDLKISELTEITTPLIGDVLPIVNSGTTKKVTIGNLRKGTIFTVVGLTEPADYLCDGVADDVQIKAAVDYVAALGGGLVFIKRGVYNFAGIVTVSTSNVSIIGEGKGITVLTCGFSSNNGMFLFYKGTAAVNNIQIKNLSFDLNSKPGGAIYITGTTTGVVTKDYLLEDIEIYNHIGNNLGARAEIRIMGPYAMFGLTGTFENITLNRVTLRDSLVTDILTYELIGVGVYGTINGFNVTDCYFHNHYGTSILMYEVSGVHRQNKNWKIDGCLFRKTKIDSPFGNYGDLFDQYRVGFDGISITNCIFDDTECVYTDYNEESFNLMIYNSRNVLIDHNIFKGSRQCLALGFLDWGCSGWTVSNNIVYQALTFNDFDSHFNGTFSNNIFYEVKRFCILGGYAKHDPSVYSGNFFYNCNSDPDLTGEVYQSIFEIVGGAQVVENNVVYDDLGASSGLKYFIYEIGTYYETYLNIYKNNTIIGVANMTCGFFLDAGYKHHLEGNTGLPEHRIYNQATNAVAGDSALAATDIARNNYDHNNDLIDGIAYSVGNVTGNTTFNVGNATEQKATLTGSIVVTLSTGMYEGQILTLILTQGGTGSYTYTKTATTKLAGGAVTLTAAVGSVDILKFRWDGTNWNEVNRSLDIS